MNNYKLKFNVTFNNKITDCECTIDSDIFISLSDSDRYIEYTNDNIIKLHDDFFLKVL